MKHIRPEKINLKNNITLNEKWVQQVIAEDPSILGLGELILKDKERIQPRAGRLDLLLQDVDTNRRYEVEIQLGKTDESHIIRTLEYWDIERKRYPQYDHCAVIIAEDITSRFLNVISLFNGFIPLIAIQVSAYKFSQEHVSLVFTTVLDEVNLGLSDEDEEVKDVTDRNYWETVRGTKQSVSIADDLLQLVHTFDSGFSLKYNKYYIGLAKDGHPNNFIVMKPRKTGLMLGLKIDHSSEIQDLLDSAKLDTMDYDKRWRRFRVLIDKSDIQKNKDLLISLLKRCYGFNEEETS